MVTQSEQVLENALIKTLQDNGYEYIQIKEEENLQANDTLPNSSAKFNNPNRLLFIFVSTFISDNF
ncbi:MAG: hypothetical protein LBU51_02290 [Bacteroidales bacterium]|jgi:hypothetical protein|nr:hypothetical protein [Bacteroidales bacterium]